jgi:hypothetical protein
MLISDSTPAMLANPQVRRCLDGIPEQRRLPDPGASAQHQRAAEATAHRV